MDETNPLSKDDLYIIKNLIIDDIDQTLIRYATFESIASLRNALMIKIKLYFEVEKLYEYES